MAVGARVGRIEQLHRAQVDLAALEHEPQGRLETDAGIRHGRQALVDKGVDGRVFLPEDLGVVRVGRDALEPEQQGVLQGEDVGVCGRVGLQSRSFPLGDEPLEGVRRPEAQCIDVREASARRPDPVREPVASPDGLPDQVHEARRVEVHVRQRREERLHREDVRLAVDDPPLASLGCGGRKADEGVDQEVLQGGHVVRLAADSPLRAGLALCRLFALVTEHEKPPLGNLRAGAHPWNSYDTCRGNSLTWVKKGKKS